MNLRKLIKKNLSRIIGTVILLSAVAAFAYSTYHFALFPPKYFWVSIEIALFITGWYLLARPRQNEKSLLSNAPVWVNKKKIEENINLNRVNTRNILEGVTLVLLLGLTTIGFYSFHSCFDAAFALFTLLAITGGAAFLTGSFIGFLFGIPRYNS